MSNLSDLIPAGGGQNNTDFVADGAIASGKPVILTAAGKAAEVVAISASAGTPVVFETASVTNIAATYDSNSEKVVIAYEDEGNSDHGTAVVGTVSGTAISYGTPVVFEAAATSNISITFDSNSNKVVIVYRDDDNSNQGTAIVGTVSGTAISYGTPVVFESGNSYYTSATFDSSNNKVVISYGDGGNSGALTSIVGTVSGTDISFGTAVVYDAGGTVATTAITFDSNSNKVVIGYQDSGVSSYGTAIVGTVSGTSISFGTKVVFEAAATYFPTVTFDSTSNKVVIAYNDQGNSQYGTSIVGTVSDTSISFGTAVVFESAVTNWVTSTYDSNTNKAVIAYQDNGNSNYGTAIDGTVSGTAISFGSTTVFEAADTRQMSATFDTTQNKVVIAYKDADNSDYGTGVVYSTISSNMTASNLLGIASGAILDTATGTINTWSSRNEVQSGLTIASDYYAQGDGTITTSSSGQLLGKALSATQINIKDYTG